MNRETTTLEVGGHSFVVKTYATARESQAIRAALFKGAKVAIVGDQPTFKDFDPSILSEMQVEMVRQLVISMDGQAESVADRCLDLPSNVFDELVKELDGVVAKKN